MDQFQIFHRYLERFYPIPRESASRLYDRMSEVTYDKSEIITWPGDTERYLYFVLEGVQRSYYVKDDKEHIIAFTYPPSFSGIPESFFTRQPSKFCLSCITVSRLLRLPRATLDKLMDEDREIERLMRITTEYFLAGLVQRYHEQMSLSMEERFHTFMERSAHLLQKVPQKYIASYLNMDPTNLSKLLGKHKI